jgi:hypothetical protein
MPDITVYELEDALRRQVIAFDPASAITAAGPEEGGRAEATAADPRGAARDLLDAIAVARGGEPAASDDMPDAAFTHTVRGYFGEELTIVAYAPVDDEDGGAVEFVIRDQPGKTALSAHISSPAEREALAKAWMEACRFADGYPAVRQEARALAEADDRARLDSFPDPDYPGDQAAVAGQEGRRR